MTYTNRYDKHTHTHTVKGSQFLLIYNRLKENLFKENPAVKFQKGSGAVFGHQLLHGKWVYHNLTSIQSSRLRDLINEEAVERLDSLKQLLLTIIYRCYHGKPAIDCNHIQVVFLTCFENITCYYYRLLSYVTRYR